MPTPEDDNKDPAAAIRRAADLHRGGRLADAEAAYSQILARHPNEPQAWFGLGSVKAQNGDLHAAILHLEHAMALMGQRPELHHNLAVAKARLGRFAEAEAHFREALRLRPDYTEAYYNYVNTRVTQDRDTLLARIEGMLSDQPRTDRDLCFLLFAAGRLCDENGDHDRAFAHHVRANSLKHQDYKPDACHVKTAEIMEVFDRDTLRRLRPHGFDDGRFVFIVGMPRSGTTLVEQILSAHPSVHGGGELPDISAISRTLGEHTATQRDYPRSVLHVGPEAIRGFGKAYARGVGARAPDAKRITDKSPLNFQHVGLISVLLPNAKIIHCTRHPLDTCLSCFFQNFVDNHEYSFSLDGLGHFYADYRRLMRHWDGVIDDPPLTVEYERLVAEPEREARRLIGYLGLPWDPSCLRFDESRRPVQTASRWQVRQPIYTTSTGRWRAYEAQLAPLIRVLRERGVDV
jgi:tetratricopeptide (TPR) repeat protein